MLFFLNKSQIVHYKCVLIYSIFTPHSDIYNFNPMVI